MKRPRNHDQRKSDEYTQCLDCGFETSFPAKRNYGLSEKWQISGLGHEIYKMRLEHLVTSDNKEATKDY